MVRHRSAAGACDVVLVPLYYGLGTDSAKDMAVWLRAITAGSILICLALGSGVIRASQVWTKASTDHIELYTSSKTQPGLKLLRRLENTRRILQSVMGFEDAENRQTSFRLKVIAFGSNAGYAAYRSNSAASAYYLEGPNCSYLVLGPDCLDDYAITVHEYAHHLLHRRYRSLPAWLDEGLAEVYSSIEEKNGEIRVGLPLDDRLASLENNGFLLDLPSLFQVRDESFASLRHTGARSRFYAESWLLTHMLRFSPEYSGGFAALLGDVTAGESPEGALLDVYGKSVVQVQKNLDGYLRRKKLPTGTFRLKPPRYRVPELSAKTMDTAELQSILAELRVALGRPSKAGTEHRSPFRSAMR